MKRHCALSLVYILCLLLGCSEDSPTAPDDEGGYTLEGTETLGAAGGTIEIGDFSLTVPAGAFDGDHTLQLFASSNDRPFDQHQVTRAFRLEGLPDEFSLPLQLSIKYDGTLSEESFVALGERFFDYVQGDWTTTFSLHSASESSGYLVGEVPPVGSGTALRRSRDFNATTDLANSTEALELLGLSGYRGIYTDHFWIGFPVDLVEVSATAVETMLEDVYAKVVTDLQLPWRWAMRLNVVITDLGPSVGAYSSPIGSKIPMLSISRQHLSQGDFTTVRVAVGEELLSWILLSFDESAVDPGHFWLWNAVVAWSEEVFTDDAEYLYPVGFPNNEMAPFNGMNAGAGDGSDIDREFGHGHGMSAVIKYLVDDPRFGTGGIKSTYETIQTGSDATAALLNNVDATVADWWPEFFTDHVGGGIYGVGGDVFTSGQNLSGTWTIDDENDTMISFTHDFPDLSAKLYLINLNYGSIDESARLMLTLTGELTTPVSVIVFRVDGASADYLGRAGSQGSATLEVLNLHDLIEGGLQQLLVVAVNCNVSDTYLEQSNLDLEMKILTEPVFPGFNSFDFMIRVVGQWRHVIGDNTNEYDDDLEEEPWGLVDVIPGEMTDENTFEGSFESEGASGEVIATFSPDMDTVRTVSLEMTWDSQDGRQWSHSFVARDVPISADLTDWAWFRVDGAAACSVIDDVQYMYSNPSSDETKTLTGFYCTDQGSYPSLLILQFHKE